MGSERIGKRRATGQGMEAITAFCLDALVVAGALFCALHLRFGAVVPELDRRDVHVLLPLLYLARLGAFHAAGLYRRSFLHPRGFDSADLLQAWAAGTVILAASVFFGGMLVTSRLVLAYEAALSLLGFLGWRVVVRGLWRIGRAPQEAWLLGAGATRERLDRFLAEEGWEYRIAGAVDRVEDLPEEAGAVFVEPRHLDLETWSRLADRRVFVIAGVAEILTTSLRRVDCGGCVLLDSGSLERAHHYLLIKRAMDVLVSLSGLLLLAPLFLLIALLVRFTSRGPVFYVQKRIGRGGRQFAIYKFRTMRHGAAGPAMTREGDDRVTPVGRFLRRWSLDELPQLVNVLFGSMSLVGPRPEVPEIVGRYPDWQRAVLDAVPGLTGLVQISGRDELNDEEKARLDLFYVMNSSFELDISILLRTARAIVRFRGRC